MVYKSYTADFICNDKGVQLKSSTLKSIVKISHVYKQKEKKINHIKILSIQLNKEFFSIHSQL